MPPRDSVQDSPDRVPAYVEVPGEARLTPASSGQPSYLTDSGRGEASPPVPFAPRDRLGAGMCAVLVARCLMNTSSTLGAD